MTPTLTVPARPARVVTPDPPARRRPDFVLVGLWIGLVVSAAIWALPFLFLLLSSVKTQADITSSAAWALPTTWEWANYSDAWTKGALGTTGLNSLLVAVVKVPLGLAISAAAAFALSRLRFRFSRTVLGLIALGSMIPVQVALGPMFRTMAQLDLLNSHAGLLLPYLAFGIPYETFVLYGFFRNIPTELDDAARIDGASNLRLFVQVVLPLAGPILAALFILDFVATWNEYAMASTLLLEQQSATVPLAIQRFNTQFQSSYGPLNAFIVMSILPVLIVYLLFQRYFTHGALAGAVKG